MELAEKLRAHEIEEHAVTLMRAYHTALWGGEPEAEVKRLRAEYDAFVAGIGHDPLGDA